MARPKSNGSKDSTATIGFEAKLWLTADTATRGRASAKRGTKLRSATERRDNLRNNMATADWSGATKTATGSPKGERGGANQYSRAERDRSPKATRRVGAEAPINSTPRPASCAASSRCSPPPLHCAPAHSFKAKPHRRS